ncbi:GntR family transcriptional regulator [Marinivivus vitaminiproducens]|uniref:GntR family transcriptional regulator n=1 Tax=Marinivivus vitaminiproducens TaxID=3035935 RepID=UPI00279D0385|nr:GntR family transcriptional regulator [Geminicoccaceae bacterium SCSIO 64248]
MDTSTSETFSPLIQESAPLRNKIIQSLRRAIETGALQPGTRLVENDLCKQLKVSRTSLREALRQLQAEGILTNTNNRGLTVATVTLADAENIYRLRGVIEPLVVQQFIENANAVETKALTAQGEIVKSAYRDGSAEDIVVSKRDFYDLICSGARNAIAFEILKKLTLLTSPLRRRSVVQPNRRLQSIDEIDAIMAAIARGDSVAACAAAERHVSHSARSVFQMLEKEGRTAKSTKAKATIPAT